MFISNLHQTVRVEKNNDETRWNVTSNNHHDVPMEVLRRLQRLAACKRPYWVRDFYDGSFKIICSYVCICEVNMYDQGGYFGPIFQL